jgi:hypothetical protein
MGVGGEESQCGENGWRNLLGSELGVWVPLAGQQQVKNARVASLCDDLFNGVAAIEEPTRGTVDVADRRLGANDACQARAEWLLDNLLVTHRRGRLSTNSSASRKITDPSSATKTDPVNPPGSP